MLKKFFGFGDKSRAKPLVMHVDDDKDILGFLYEFLVGMGFDVVSVSNGPEALKLARSNVPDLVILDIRMPGMDGFDVCWQLKNNSKTAHVPVLMMTAMAQMKDVERAMAQGANGYAVKPVDFPTLKAKIQKLLKLPAP